MPPQPHRHLLTTDVAAAAERLRRGGLVAIPTETVYGLAARADEPAALARLYELKGRPRHHPVILHAGSIDQLAGWAEPLPPPARRLADACWPGPLTLLVRRGPRTPDAVTGGRVSVGVRIPAHPLTLQLLDRLPAPLAAPSANRFGRVSPTCAAHVLDDLGEALDPARDAVLDGGTTTVGVESTIVDCTADPPQVLRPGGIPATDIARVLGTAPAEASGPSRAAGMLTAHYAPVCTVELVEDRVAADRRRHELTAAGVPAAVLDHAGDPVRYAQRLYADLRAADRAGVAVLVAVLPPAEGLGHAVRDRLRKAAATSRPAGPHPGLGDPRPDPPSPAR